MVLGVTGCGNGATGSAGTQSPPASGGEATSPADGGGTAAVKEEPAVNFPDGKPITLLIGYSAGGGSDITARTMVPYLEKALGTTITCVNMPGASGWVAWEELTKSDPDGYTIALTNWPNVFAGYLDPSTGRTKTMDDFQLLANLVTDTCCLVVKKGDSRFTDLDSFLKYCESNIVTLGSSGAGTDDEVCFNQFIDLTGAKNISYVRGDGWSEMYPAVLGGHIDSCASNIGECTAAYQNGEVDVLCVFSDERSEFMPDVPTFKELTGQTLVASSMRGIAMPAGADPGVVAVFDTAFAEACSDEELVDDYRQQGLMLEYFNSGEYTTVLKNLENTIKGMLDLMGWA